MAIFQIWGDFPVEKLRLKMSSSSCLALGPRHLRNVGGFHLARISSSSSILKAAQQLSPAVGDFSVDFSCRMRFLSSLLKRRRLTAAFSFMKALALLRLVVKVRPFCSRGSATVVEEGVPDSDLIVLHVRAGSGLFSRSARNSSHFFWRASSESLRVAARPPGIQPGCLRPFVAGRFAF